MKKLLAALAISASVVALSGAAQAADKAADKAVSNSATTATSATSATTTSGTVSTTAGTEAISSGSNASQGQQAVYGDKNAAKAVKQLSSNEITKMGDKRFEALDANKDGKLSLLEFQSVPSDIKTSDVESYKAQRAELFSKIDSSKQGSISKDQFVKDYVQSAEMNKVIENKAVPASQVAPVINNGSQGGTSTVPAGTSNNSGSTTKGM
ncbi:MAG: EF-hand domain-containing protein [Holosporaceae bacterium]